MDEADPGFQLLTDEEIAESLKERNENEKDSDEDGENDSLLIRYHRLHQKLLTHFRLF